MTVSGRVTKQVHSFKKGTQGPVSWPAALLQFLQHFLRTGGPCPLFGVTGVSGASEEWDQGRNA